MFALDSQNGVHHLPPIFLCRKKHPKRNAVQLYRNGCQPIHPARKQVPILEASKHHNLSNETTKILVIDSTLLLMEEILHQLKWRIYHYLQGFVHVKWLFGISEPSTVSQPFRTHEKNMEFSLFPTTPQSVSGWWFQPI